MVTLSICPVEEDVENYGTEKNDEVENIRKCKSSQHEENEEGVDLNML